MRISSPLTFTICLLIPLLMGGFSGFLSSENINTWYVTLIKPSFNPPNYIFGPIWTILYLLMGISLYLIWQSPMGTERINALIIFSFQLVLNFAWSLIFFKYRLIGYALLEIMLLWFSILLMIFVYHHLNKTAAYLQIPYLIWVSFASVLNAAIYKLN